VPSKKITGSQVATFAESLPNVMVGAKWHHKTWMVNDRGFLWERPLGKADLERLGGTPPPQGEIMAITVEDLDAKDALLTMELPGFFTIQHFNNFPAVLVELRLARLGDVKTVVEAAWRVVSAKPPLRKRAKKRAKKPAAARSRRK
jgi:hypothetical protein